MDLWLFDVIHSLAGQSGVMDWLGVFLAKYLAYLLAVAALVFIAKQSAWRERIWTFSFIFLTALLSRGIITEIIRFIWDRPRPFAALGFTSLISESGAAFPSGHAAFYFALAFAIFFFNKRWGIWFLGLSLLNGLARIFVGVHWPSDILAGVVIAYLSFLAVKELLKQYEPKFELTQKNPA